MDLSKAGVAAKTDTGIQRALLDVIRRAGFRYVVEYPVMGPKKANYFLDFYLPEFHVGAEADGPLHDKRKDAERDKWIRDTQGITIIRFVADEFRAARREIAVRKLVEFCDTEWYTIDQRRSQ